MVVAAHGLARRSMLALLSVLLACVVFQCAAARANAYSAVEHVYATTGTVPACRFSARELQSALRQTPTYDLEYFGSFPAAVQTALQGRAGGECQRRTHPAAATAATAAGTPLPPQPRLPAAVSSPTAAAIPWPLLVAVAILIACGLGVAGVTAVRAGGWDPEWAQAARHAWREAEFRAGEAAEDLRDRLGA